MRADQRLRELIAPAAASVEVRRLGRLFAFGLSVVASALAAAHHSVPVSVWQV